jgi:hypothetical protein
VWRALVVVAAAAAGGLLPASPAWAHGAHAPSATNYRTQITAVTPALDGVTVRLIEAGTGLQLTNRTSRPVHVLGYQSEPYLEIRTDGVYENVYSPAVYLNRDYTGTAPVPDHADATTAPSWRRVSDVPVARWYDHRTHWMGPLPPPAVAADPGSTHRVLRWTVPVRHGGTAAEVTGTLEWVPPPSPWPCWAGAVLAAAAAAALGPLAGAAAARGALGGLAIGGGVLALGYAAGRELDAGAAGPGEVLVWLATGQVWAALSALAAVAAGAYLVAGLRRTGGATETGLFALTVAGACLAIFAGLADAAVLARSVPPVPFDPVLARITVATVSATGAGITAAAALGLRRSGSGAGEPVTVD